MKPILRAEVLNRYRSFKPKGFYSPIKGHTGVDLKYNFEELPSPVTGKVILTTRQVEMGNCLYLQDSLGSIHVFAHLDKYNKHLGDSVQRNEILGTTGKTGSKVTGPHLHYEIITTVPYKKIPDWIMKRSLSGYSGYNTDPLQYLKDLYFKYHVDLDGNPITNI